MVVLRRLKNPTLLSKFTSVNKHVKYAFIIAIVSISMIELVLKKFPAPYDFWYLFGDIYLRICYSIVPASIFFFINQHLPKFEKKYKSMMFVYSRVKTIQEEISFFIKSLKIPKENEITEEAIWEACARINPFTPIANKYESNLPFNNWYDYFNFKCLSIRQNIRDLKMLNEVLDTDLLLKLSFIDTSLTHLLRYASIEPGNTDLKYCAKYFHRLHVESEAMNKVFVSKYKDFVTS